MMGAPDIPKPQPIAPAPDLAEAELQKAQYASTQKRLGLARGRQGSFLTAASPAGAAPTPIVPKMLLGQ